MHVISARAYCYRCAMLEKSEWLDCTNMKQHCDNAYAPIPNA